MNVLVADRIIVRPFSSRRGLYLLSCCIAIGFLFFVASLFIFIVAPMGDRQASILMIIMGIMSVIAMIIGIIFYFVFPRSKIIFDSIRKEVLIKIDRNSITVVPFDSLQPFHIYHILRGYAHQYYCSNASFGEFSDLFFSSSHGKTLKKAQKLAELTGAALIDDEGKTM